MASAAEIARLVVRLSGDSKHYNQMLVKAGIDMTKFTVDAVGRVHNLEGQYVDAFDAMNNSAAKSIMKLQRFGAQIKKTSAKVKQLGRAMQSIGRTLSLRVTAPLLAMAGIAVKVASNLESSFAGIRKTTDATEEQFAVLKQGMRDLSKEIPINVNTLNRIGEVGGQLGIAKENLLEFTKVMADLGVATDLTSEEAAIKMARLANITGLAQSEFDRLGSAIVELGNNFATTEPEILAMATRLAGSGTIAGLLESDILAIGAAMTSVGIEAQAGGTAVQKVLLGMTESVNTGNEKLAVFAATAGMSAAKFAKVFREDAAGAFTAFVEGIGRMGQDAFGTLAELELKDGRLVRAFLSLGGAGDLLARTMKTSSDAFAANTALAEEAAKRYATFASQMTILKNKFMDVVAALGEQLIPVIQSLIPMFEAFIGRMEELVAWFKDLNTFQKSWVVGILAAIAALGPLLTLVGTLTIAVAALGIAMAFLAANPLSLMIIGVTALVALLGTSLVLGLGKAIAKLMEFVTWLFTSNKELERGAKLDAELAKVQAKQAMRAQQAATLAAVMKANADKTKAAKVPVEIEIVRSKEATETIEDLAKNFERKLATIGKTGPAGEIAGLLFDLEQAGEGLSTTELKRLATLGRELTTRKEELDAIKEQEKLLKKMEDKALAMIEAIRTPLEKLKDEFKDIDALVEKGLLTEDQAGKIKRGKAKPLLDADKSSERKTVSKFTRAGSIESFRARAQARKDAEAKKARKKREDQLDALIDNTAKSDFEQAFGFSEAGL